MKYFIEKGVDGIIPNNDGFAALHDAKITRFNHFYLLFLFFIALTRGHPDVVKYFIAKGFDENIQNNDGCSTLHHG